MKRTAKSRYTKLEGERREYLERARAAAELTLPYLLTREGHNSTEDLPTPYQSIGARGVNNLTAKMLMALFPVNQPIFRLTADEVTMEELAGREGARAAVEEAFARMERITTSTFEGRAYRPVLNETLRHLIVTGNGLLHLDPEDGQLRFFSLTKYVVRRSPKGKMMEAIVKESVLYGELPEDVQEAVAAARSSKGNASALKEETQLDLYTAIAFKKGKYHVHQEVDDVLVEGTEATYNPDACPWVAVRFNRVDGESYGRGYVEEYIGDLISCEGLSQAILETAAGAARLLFLVNPNGTTDKRDLAEAPNGEFVDGNAADVQALQTNKASDLRVPYDKERDLVERLSFAFLLNSAIQRSGERVTAEEIRFMAQELESALGGIYSVMSQELQLPLVQLVMRDLESKGKLPKLPKETVKPVVVTGIEALGRGQDLNRLQTLIQAVGSLPGAIERFNIDDLIMRVAASLGIDTKGLVKTQEQMDAERQQAAMMQAGMNAAAPVAGQLAKAATEPPPEGAPQ